MFDRKRAFVKKLLHEGVVALGDHLHQRLVRFCRRPGQLRRNVGFAALPGRLRPIDKAFHAHQIHDTREIPLRSHGQVHRNGRASEVLLDAVERTLKAGQFPIQPVDNQRTRQVELVAEVPDFFGLDLHAGHAVHQHQSRIGGHQCCLRVIHEQIEARGVEKVDLLFLPFGEGYCRGDGELALDLLRVEVRERIAFVHARQPAGSPGEVKNARRERGLAAMPMSQKGHVADVGPWINLHGMNSSGLRLPAELFAA